MKNQENKWILLVCMVLLLLVAGCKEPPVEKSEKPASPVVSRAIPQQPVQKAIEPENAVSPETSLPAQSGLTPEISGNPEPAKEKKSTESDKKEQNDRKKASQQVPETGIKQNITQTDVVLEISDSIGYVAKSRVDPFMPLIQEKKEIPAPEIQKPDKPQRVLTPLEKMELSQIKLVAVVIMEDRKIAMVEEATGKGYEVGIGTYMGKNQGRVIDITFDTIVVKEIVTDYKGNQIERLQEIKIHKKDSGE